MLPLLFVQKIYETTKLCRLNLKLKAEGYRDLYPELTLKNLKIQIFEKKIAIFRRKTFYNQLSPFFEAIKKATWDHVKSRLKT